MITKTNPPTVIYRAMNAFVGIEERTPLACEEQPVHAGNTEKKAPRIIEPERIATAPTSPVMKMPRIPRAFLVAEGRCRKSSSSSG
jgi:hypothetical protein